MEMYAGGGVAMLTFSLLSSEMLFLQEKRMNRRGKGPWLDIFLSYRFFGDYILLSIPARDDQMIPSGRRV